MADTATAEIRALLGASAGEDRVAASHFVAGAVFLVVGGILSALALAALRFGDLIPISYGRLEPMANLSLIVGFGVISLVGGVYYVLPRLTGARLAFPGLARAGLLGMSALVVLGDVAIALGLGTGRQPFGTPWWLHFPMLFVLAVPALVVVGSVAARTERRAYVTIWYALAGTVWLPLLYLTYFAGELPFLGAVQVAYSDAFFSAGVVTMVLCTLGSGLFYYTVVKELDTPLASRQLALVGLWSFGFASVWWGVAQLTFGPAPSWVAGVAAALGLAFPIGALANAANVSVTLEGSWSKLSDKPAVTAGLAGLYLALGVAALAAIAGFRSVGSVTALTSYWEAVDYAALNGVSVLLVAGVSFGAVPRLVGRQLHPSRWSRSFATLTLAGTVGVLISLVATGLMSGYSWLAGSNSAAYVDAGDGWGAGVGGSVDTLLLMAVAFGLLTLAGHLSYASTIFSTLTRGTAISQEVLIDKEGADE